MTDINDLLAPSSDRRGGTGGFTGFVIGVFEGIQGLIFVAIWIAAGTPFLVGGVLLFRYDNGALLGAIAGIIVGFLVAVMVTGFAEIFIDMRRQLVAIRKRLDDRGNG